MKAFRLIIVLMCVMVGSAWGTEIKSFCEYGTAISLRLGAGGALWEQTWGEKPWDWFEGGTKPNNGFLNKNSFGLFETTTAGAPDIDADMILKFDFGGTLVLEASDDRNPGKVAGSIVGTVDGLFVADLNADRALVDEDAGTITIAFGAPVHSGPDGLITVTETTGKFKNMHPIGLWEWYVNGGITIQRIPSLPLQTNILAALAPNSPLLLGGYEEIVLAGSYYRSAPGK